MPMSPRRNEAQAVAGAWSDWCRANSLNGGRIDLFLSAIAVDNGARDVLDNGAEAGSDRPPAQPVHQRVLKGFQRLSALRRIGQNGRVIFAPGMGHRQQDRQRSARRMKGRWRVGAHMQQRMSLNVPNEDSNRFKRRQRLENLKP